MSPYPLSNRFRVFREHKFIISLFSDLVKKVGVLDFGDIPCVSELHGEVKKLADMLHSHATYEETRLMKLLIERGSPLMKAINEQHQSHEQEFEGILAQIDAIKSEPEVEKRFELGYRLYLVLRKLFADMLLHLDDEERLIMPELQRLMTDDEIKAVEHDTYAKMLPEHMVQMMRALIPYFNPDDRSVFFLDMYKAQKQKFLIAWEEIKTCLAAEEAAMIESKLGI